MNFFTVQSLNNYTKNLGMQMKWQRKKETSDFTADGSTKITDPVRKQAEEIRKSRADGSDEMSSQIRLKLNTGKKLTAEEMEYLQKHDPQTYQKVKSIEAEQKQLEKELKECKTKEEVQRVRMTHTAQSLSAVNSIKNNPVIPEGQKLGLIMQEYQKHLALEETAQEFVESGRYAKLPTEEERRKAEEDLKEAKEAELGIEDPAKDPEKEEKAEESEGAKDGAESAVSAEKAEKSELTEAEVRQKKADMDAMLKEKELTRMEAENTPEALKVKRARAEAAYKVDQVEIRPGKVMDIKEA